MDSGNSGSLQSSSGGDDEFDSRAGGGGGGGVDSSPLSALLRPSPSPSAAAFSLHGSYFGLQELTSAPPPHHQQQPQAGTWSSGSFPGASGLSSSSSPRVGQPDSGAGGRQQTADTTTVAAAQGQGAAMGAPAPAQQPPRGSRKRTRASRRAPTTVLTTDTSNFRAMVQEFTGIPSPPFAAGVGVGGPAASLRTRFDHIFSPPSSSLRSAAAADATASLPPYLLRPFPQKLPTVPSSSFPPFTTTSSSSSSSTPSSSNIGVANANAATGTAATAAAPSNSNPGAPAGAGDTFQQLTSSALLRLQQDPSSYLSFQNLLDSQPSSQSIFGAAAGGFGQASSRLHDPAPSPSDFLASVGSGSLGGLTHHGGLLGSEGLRLHHHSRSDDVHGHGHGGDELLSGVVAAGASGGGSCKLNYSSHAGAAASSSGAASADKPPDGGGAGAAGAGRPGRGEGQLDPWICTSE